MGRAGLRWCTVRLVGTGPATSWAGDRVGLGGRLGARVGLGDEFTLFEFLNISSPFKSLFCVQFFGIWPYGVG